MKHLTYIISGIILAAFTFLVLLNLGIFSSVKDDAINTEKFKIAATIFPIYDIALNIAGDEIYVELLLPAGASPHFYDPSPKRIVELQKTKTILAIGHGLDNWSYNIAEAIPGSAVFIVDNNIQLKTVDQDIDPHYWLSFSNSIIIADNIRDALISIDPDNKDKYQQNTKEYKLILLAEMNSLKLKLENLDNRKIIALHDAWNYFAKDFNLEVVGSFEPSPGENPSPGYISKLRDEIIKNNVEIIFAESQFSSSAFDNFAEDNNLTVALLDPIGGVAGRESFLNLMQYNVNSILGLN